ncbi:phosphatase PAP2 family protein [Lichenibacterium dinghuense]|uniref:phosphatase PAP2 family protein n=1 Tax=Lichenibacterium dinghuense TaxID=2895977 RepID=UPI001F359ABC|nr:phosphatase PAP2 family protein [Lichenibacterium sp. 6Y81]
MIAAAVLFPLALSAAGLVDAAVATDAARAPRAVVEVGRFVTEFGTSGYMFTTSALLAAVALVALGRDRHFWNGARPRLVVERCAFFFATIAASGIAAQAVKHLLGRARPVLSSGADPFTFHPLSLGNSIASFPSGHTTSAFAAAVALGLVSPRLRPWLLGGAALVGISRVVVGAHYPSDVVGGAALGSLAAVAVTRICARRGLAFTLDAGRAVPKRSDCAAPVSPIGRDRNIES